MLSKLKDKLRTWEFAALALVGIAAVIFLVPHRLASLIGMVSQFTIAAYLGYWVDRICFPYARPHEVDEGPDQGNAMMRRALIMAGALIGAGMSL